jgi:hypothetical protein
MEGDQQPSAGPDRPCELRGRRDAAATIQMNDRIRRHGARPPAVADRQCRERADLEPESRVRPASDRDHARRGVDPDDLELEPGEVCGDVARPAADIGDCVPRVNGPDELGEHGVEGAVDRLAGELTAELPCIPVGHGVVAPGRLVRSAHIQYHAPGVRNHIRFSQSS